MANVAEVVMYGTRFCPYCQGARQFFDSRGIDYVDIRVDEEPARRDEMRTRGGGRTVPQIWINATHVGGYTDLLALDREGRLETLLEEPNP